MKKIIYIFIFLSTAISFAQLGNPCAKYPGYQQWFRDFDGDTFGSSSVYICALNQPPGYVSNSLDCNDKNASIGAGTTWYDDTDGDGFGDPNIQLVACNQPIGYVANDDDNCPLTNGPDDGCPTGTTSDCDGKIAYFDGDGDGYGNLSGPFECVAFGQPVPTGYSANYFDCDDTDPNSAIMVFYYIDNDGDGNGGDTGELSCSPISGHVTNNLDCNDSNYNPSDIKTIWYADTDNDTFGDLNTTKYACSKPNGYVANSNDNCPTIYGLNSGCPSGGSSASENGNWIISKSFDIQGVVNSHSKSYFDDLGKITQSQSVDIKTGKTWASNTMYDGRGRPAISTLSAPINNTGTFLYKTNFIKKTNGSTYSYGDYENDVENPSTVGSQVNTLGWYYSQNNTSEPYQDITSYPFSRTIYSTLNPGTSLKTIGGNKINGEWKNGFSYSMPAAQEMYYVFGKDYFGASTPTEEVITKFFKSVAIDVHGEEAIVFTDGEGKTLAAARSGGTNKYEIVSVIGEQKFVDIHIPKGIVNSDISFLGSATNYKIYNLRTEEVVNSTAMTGGNIYRVEYLGTIENTQAYVNTSGQITTPSNVRGIRYKVNYYDYTLNYYDKVGRLIESTQPLGFDVSSINSSSIIANPTHGMKSTYTYNALNQLLETTSPDEGTATFKYRKDGQIRYSQNSKQAANNEFSYTNYDDKGRPEESGVIQSTAFTTANPDTNALPSGTLKERHITLYDEADLTGLHAALTSESISTTHYAKQNFLAGNVSKTHTLAPATSTTWYNYDIYGRVTWVVQKIEGLGTKTIDYEYDPIKGHVAKVIYQKHKASELFAHQYTYNSVSQLVAVATSTNNSSFTTRANYEYYETGALKRKELEGNQNVDYVYNLAGQLKAINHPSLNSANDPGGDSNDVFGMMIDYYSGDYARTGTPTPITTTTDGIDRYDGNIKATRWANIGSDGNPSIQHNAYTYTYNKNNWLTEANYGTTNNSATITPNAAGDYKVTNLTYDANGNLLSLDRNKSPLSGGGNAMDKFTYNYNTATNQLNHVSDAVTAPTGVDDLKSQPNNNYDYNSIGQLEKNNQDDIEYIYNASGLVTSIKKDGSPFLNIYYDDKGKRVHKEVTYNGLTWYDTYYTRDIAGNVMSIYSGNHTGSSAGTATVKEYPIYGASRLGMYNKSANKNTYEINDHLGNVRAVVSSIASNNSYFDYYPFGMQIAERKIVGGEYRYAFQGQEKDPETQKEAFQLRLWDGRIGRWLTTDPAGQYASPYLGMGNNPINRVDPDGGIDRPRSFDASKLNSGKSEFSQFGSLGDLDWYRNNTTNEIEWFDGSFDIEGYTNIGFNFIESVTDVNNNTTLIKYDGNTKSSYLYNSKTAIFDFLKNYDNSSKITKIIMNKLNGPLVAGDQFTKALVVGFQGSGILLYEGVVNGREMEGMNIERLGYKPALDGERTLIFNNGKWIHINVHSLGEGEFAKYYAKSFYDTTSIIKIPSNFGKAKEFLKKYF